MMQTVLVAAVLCALLAAAAPSEAQSAAVAQWRLDADADGDGVADGWAARCEAGGAAFTLGTGPAGAVVQQVTGARNGDSIARELTGLDPQATYLVTASVNVTQGGVVWGPEGVREKYLAAYSRPVVSRVTFAGRDAVTIIFAAQDKGTAFSVESVRVERIEKSPLPVEADTGRFLVPRPRSIRYQPGETAGCTLEAGTRIALAGLQPERVNLGLLREDLGFEGDAMVVGPDELSEAAAPALLVGTPDALRAQLPALPPALAAAVNACSAALPEEGYYLTVTPDGIVVVATSEAAGQYGLQTLRQLCAPAGEGRWRVPTLTIEDWPALPFRGTYQTGVTATPERLDRARYYARLKLNAVVMEDELLYHLHEGDNLARARDYLATLRSLHLEPIPLVQSFGWGMYVLAIDPQCVEARYVEGRPMRFATHGEVAPEARGLVTDDGREYLVSPQLLTPLAGPLRNASFEQLEGGRPADWQADSWTDTDGAAASAEAPVAGAGCLELDRQTRGIIRVYQDFEVPEDSSLQFTVSLKLKGIDGDGAYAEIYRVTESGELVGNPVAMTTWLTGTRDWQPYRMTLDTGDHRWYRIYLRIQEAVGTAWFDDLQVGLADTDLCNLVHTEDSLRLTDQAGNALVAGRDYEVLPGETRFPFTADAMPWRLARLAAGRVPAGGQVLLSYEYAPVGAMTYCPSDPRTQAIMRDTLGTVVRELGVKRIHIGHDEPRWMNTCRRCRDRHLTNAQLFADELTRMREYATAADPEVRVMMWADALNPYHNAPAQELEPANDTTPRDIIQCTWFYSAGDDIAEARSLAYMAERGYETTGSPWYDLENNWDWTQECSLSRQMTGKCLGTLYTCWGDNPKADPWAGLSVTAAFSWNPEDPPALEMLPWSPAEMNRTYGVLP